MLFTTRIIAILHLPTASLATVTGRRNIQYNYTIQSEPNCLQCLPFEIFEVNLNNGATIPAPSCGSGSRRTFHNKRIHHNIGWFLDVGHRKPWNCSYFSREQLTFEGTWLPRKSRGGGISLWWNLFDNGGFPTCYNYVWQKCARNLEIDQKGSLFWREPWIALAFVLPAKHQLLMISSQRMLGVTWPKITDQFPDVSHSTGRHPWRCTVAQKCGQSVRTSASRPPHVLGPINSLYWGWASHL